jgi:hypothetical protein
MSKCVVFVATFAATKDTFAFSVDCIFSIESGQSFEGFFTVFAF